MKEGAQASWDCGSGSGALPDICTDPNWRSRLSVEDRQRMINNIMQCFVRTIPVLQREGFDDGLHNLSAALEADMYNTATCWFEYLQQFVYKTAIISMHAYSVLQQAYEQSLYNKEAQKPWK